MTTIAWDGKTLAADRRVTCGGVTDAKVHKIVRREDGALAGSAGNTSLGAAAEAKRQLDLLRRRHLVPLGPIAVAAR